MASPVSREMHKRLVGELSILAAEGSLDRMRAVTPARPAPSPPSVRGSRRGFPGGETAAIADNLVSNIQHLPGDTKTALDI